MDAATEARLELEHLRVKVETLENLLRVQERVVIQQADRLRQSEEKFRALSASAPIGILQIEPNGLCAYVNARCEEIAGRSADSLLDRPWLELVIPEERHQVEQRWTAFATGEAPFNLEFRLFSNPSCSRWVASLATRVQFADGQPGGFVLILEDITERRRAASELEDLHKSLAETSRKAGMAEVASGVLHNIGNVLNSINVSATLVNDALARSKLPSLTRLVELIEPHRSDLGSFITIDPRGKMIPEFLERLSRQLLTERDGLTQEMHAVILGVEHIRSIVSVQQSYTGAWGVIESFDIGELLEDALRLSVNSFERHSIQVIRELEAVPIMEGEKHKLFQILVNLISNAKHALKEVEEPHHRLTVRLSRSGTESIRIEIADNGVGISPENRARIFTLGFTTKKGGHGLGLHSCANAIKQMGGSIDVASEGPGRGATFGITVPLSARKGDSAQRDDTR